MKCLLKYNPLKLKILTLINVTYIGKLFVLHVRVTRVTVIQKHFLRILNVNLYFVLSQERLLIEVIKVVRSEICS
jgi:hypothetical protein